MSAAAAHSMPEPDVLGELLHSLSQPLTSLRCSLELSIEENDQPHENVAAALKQTERVIGVVKLMQEYLDFDPVPDPAPRTSLAASLHSVLEDLSVLVEARELHIHFRGTCNATLPISERRLTLALRYLMGWVIESQPVRGGIRFLLQDRVSESVLTLHSLAAIHESDSLGLPKSDRVGATLEQVRIAIARRVLETAGASIVIGNADGVVLQVQVPRVR
jgi:hypothetical protein